MADIEYMDSGMFTRFFPVSDEGKVAWDQMADENGVAAVLVGQAKGVIAQLRSAGYSVRKAKKVTEKEMESILDELGI